MEIGNRLSLHYATIPEELSAGKERSTINMQKTRPLLPLWSVQKFLLYKKD